MVPANPRGATPTPTLRCRHGATTLEARFSVLIGDQPAAPPPDQTWPLYGSPANTGTAYVYLGAGHDAVENPVIVAEGFPGGYPYDYLYDLMNQAGTLEALRSQGYDVILLSFANGTDLIQNNAPVVIACLQQAMAATSAPLVVGGVSMGGLVTRYALAYMEAHRMAHRTRIFFTVDTPHRGAYTALADQWFAHYLAPALGRRRRSRCCWIHRPISSSSCAGFTAPRPRRARCAPHSWSSFAIWAPIRSSRGGSRSPAARAMAGAISHRTSRC